MDNDKPEFDTMEESERIYIPDEEGNEVEFEVIMKFEVDGEDEDAKYMMVIPTEESDGEEDEVFAFRYEEEGEELKLFPIEDEEEWKLVEDTFHTLLEELD